MTLPVDARKSKTARTSVSLPAEHYAELEQIAVQNRVSVAWVIRDAVDRYLTTRNPLFHRRSETNPHEG